MRAKKILTLPDTHHGSRQGLAHPDYLSPVEKKQGDGMMLYECFCKVRDAVGKVDYVFDLGDSCDGWNPREQGEDRVAEEKRQVEMAVKIRRMIRGSPKFFCVDGSEYHRGKRLLDEQVAEKVGSPPDPRWHKHAAPTRTIEIEGVKFNIGHFITVSSSTWQYRTTPIARELILAKLNEIPANVVLRGHAHYMAYAGYITSLGMICPGWQTKSQFVGRKWMMNEPRWGCVLFRVKDGRYDWSIHENGQTLVWKPKTRRFVERA